MGHPIENGHQLIGSRLRFVGDRFMGYYKIGNRHFLYTAHGRMFRVTWDNSKKNLIMQQMDPEVF